MLMIFDWFLSSTIVFNVPYTLFILLLIAHVTNYMLH